MMVDPGGDSTFVTRLANGLFRVIGGTLEGHRGIYVISDKGQRELIGYTLTPYSFFDPDNNKFRGTINLNDFSGIDFLEKLVEDNPTLVQYGSNAQNSTDEDFNIYDFKVTNGTPGNEYSTLDGKYRGMPLAGTLGDKAVIASARDIGNIAAGIVARRNNLSWSGFRLAADGYQTLSNQKLSIENMQTQMPQSWGFLIGERLLQGSGKDIVSKPETYLYR